MASLIVSSSPHITKKGNTTRRIMLDVLIALCPALIAAVYFFGYHVVINVAVCIIFCCGFELLSDLLRAKDFSLAAIKKSTVFDLSAVVTAVILALNIPTVLNIWGLNIQSGGKIVLSFDMIIACILASAFCILLVKKLFGGIGKNFVNPAAMGRIFLFVAFGLAYVQTAPIGLSASSGATWLGVANGAMKPTNTTILQNLFIGNNGAAAVGETSVIAIMIGFVYLCIRKVIDYKLPLVIIVSTALFALVFDGLINYELSGRALAENMLAHVMSGGLVFGAVFMATDYATSPNTLIGSIIFGVGIALLTVLIRVFGTHPEGFSFALVVMNIVSVLIDKYIVPTPYGVKKEKKPTKAAA